MNEERRVTLRYLIDMYNGIFDDDVIEAVLEQRDWDTDRALDDLMVMAQGSSFNIPVDDSPGEQLTSNFHPGDPLSQQINFTSYNNEIENEEKTESEDDIIVVNEEEFCLSGESESEDEKPPPEQPDTAPPIQPPSYASVAKQPPTYQEISTIKPPSIVFTGYTSFERMKRTRDSIERVKLFVRQGFKIMVILRGCPGSGKTTLAKNILAGCNVNKNPYWYIHSTDNYFHLNEQGTYQRDASKLDEAHRWNQINVLHVIREGLTPIIIDNTCSRMWEMEAYATMAVYAGYEIEVVEPDAPWAFHATQLARKNTHGVSREHIMMILERYDYNVSSSLLLKSFNLEYAPGMAPPQVGVRELSNKELISRFEDLYNTLHVYPQQLKKLKKQQKPSRKARKRQRQLEEKNLDDIVNEIENCGETADNEDEESVKSIDLSNEVAQAFASRNLAEDSDSDKSWEDVSDESDESVESLENTSDESDDEDEINESESSSSASESEEISENEVDETVAAELAPIGNIDGSSDEKEKEEVPENPQNPDDPENMSSVNVMVDSFRNPMNLDANEVSVEITDNTRNKFSNRLYDALSKSNPRLKCFETFHGDELPDSFEELLAMEENMANVSDPSIIQSVTNIIDEEIPPVTALVSEIIKSETSDVIVQNILNNALPLIEDPIKPVISLDIDLDTATTPLESPQLLETSLTDDLIRSDNSTINDTGFSEVDEAPECKRTDDGLSKSGTFSCTDENLFENLIANDVAVADPFQDANDTLNSSLATPEVTVIYNEPEKVTDKSNKSLKNANAGNSTDDDRNSLLVEAKRITGNADSDSSYKNNLNEGDDSLVEDFDQIVSSSKFKDETDIASSLIRSIENDLWGDSIEDNAQVDVDRLPCTSENSENSDYGSNSSSSDELRIEDVHNSVNRFVNNDIKSDQAAEKKKQNIDLKNINADDDITTVELNTLKERILVSSLDKVLNQRNVEDQDGDSELKATNISRKSSVTGFQMIENKLNEKSEVNVERNDLFDEYASRDETDTVEDRTESKFWNQWMKGDSWDDTSDKDKPVDAKPPRKHDSPSKQKNTETSSIRLVNDIKTDKNKNQPAPKLKTINFEPMMNDYFKYRSYPNAEDSLFGLPAAYDAKMKNVNVNESKDSYYALNTMPKRVNDESSDDGEKKSTWSFPDNTDYEATSYVDARRSPYRNFPKNYDIDLQFLEKQDKDWPSSEKNTKNDDPLLSFEPKPHRKSVKKKIEDKTPEFVDELVQRWKSIAKEDSPPDYDKVLKWSPLNDVDVEWKDDDTNAPSCDRKPQRALGESKRNPFMAYTLTQKKDQTTNTGTDDVTQDVQYRVACCREINNDRESPVVSAIEQKMRCDKSTMTNGSSYAVKAKPIKEDLSNMFPKEMADSILDLYEKCNGNMDWIIEILMEDGYSPTDDQLEYLSSLQNVANFENDVKEKDKQPTSEKKKKSNGNGKNIRHFEDNKETDFSKKIKRKKIDFKDEKRSPDEYSADTLVNGELDDEESQGSVELFLDTTTVQQLVGYFGNPTVYSLKDCQPVVNLPVSLARQIHAYLLESVIDQAESNESLINQLAEEDIMAGQIQSMEHITEVTQNDMIEVENSLCDLINSEPTTPSATSEDSFASKLSLDLLLKSFPTVDPSFVSNTFRSNKCNYYETKKILNQIRPEVPTNLSFNLNEEKLVDLRTEDVPLFESTSVPRTEVLDQVNSYRDDAAFNYEQWQKFNEQLKSAIQHKRFGVAPYYRELMAAFKQKFDECNAKAAAVLINSCCVNNSNVIDLHFFRVTEALRGLDIFLDHHISRLANTARTKTTLYIITGRGARNGDGVSHLQPPIKSRLKRRNIEFDIQPSNTGMVVAVVRKSSLLTHDL